MPGLSGHPLEIIPFFRRFPCGLARDIVYTLIWNTLFALIFALLALLFEPRAPVLRVLGHSFMFAQCIGFLIHLGFAVLYWRWPDLSRASLAVRASAYTAVPLVCVFLGFWIAASLLDVGSAGRYLLSWRGFLTIAGLSVVISTILLAVFIPRERAAQAEAAIAREQARVAAAERAATEARMKLLEAQVEPHFLYNTLAHVASLIDVEPATARRMLDRLIALLRATATAAGGAGTGTLAAQADLLRAYLEIIELRMGPRLAWRIEVPSELAALTVPPMLLQPVVENAVKHGLEPKVDGGRIEVVARRNGTRVTLTVADTGLGVRATRSSAGTGLGLANLRSRLASLYGDAASVTIEDNAPSGTTVTIAFPAEPIPPAVNHA